MKSVVLVLALVSSVHAAEVPRWRVRGALTSGVGGGSAADQLLTVFPITLEFGFRITGGVSATFGGQGVLMGATYDACGEERRANAAFGTVGLRFDFANDKSASWVAPFLEVHGGVGGQAGGRTCGGNGVFGTGGGKLGMDVWLGRVAVTMALAMDYLPEASPISFALGATVILK